MSGFGRWQAETRAGEAGLALALDVGKRLIADILLDDAWRHNDPPPIPPMTPDQALQLLYLHEKSCRQSWDRPHRKKRRRIGTSMMRFRRCRTLAK